MKRVADLKMVTNNRIYARWFDPSTRSYVKQGKRVGRDCPLTHEECRIVVESNTTPLFALTAHYRKSMSLTEAITKARPLAAWIG